MALKVEHEIHHRKRGKNTGVGLLLVGFVAIILGLTVVKTIQLGNASKFEKFDHVARPQIIPDAEGSN